MIHEDILDNENSDIQTDSALPKELESLSFLLRIVGVFLIIIGFLGIVVGTTLLIELFRSYARPNSIFVAGSIIAPICLFFLASGHFYFGKYSNAFVQAPSKDTLEKILQYTYKNAQLLCIIFFVIGIPLAGMMLYDCYDNYNTRIRLEQEINLNLTR